MKFYRVDKRTQTDGHMGYTWHVSRYAADRDAAEFETQQEGNTSATVEKVDVPLKQAALLEFLNEFAGHPDNG